MKRHAASTAWAIDARAEEVERPDVRFGSKADTDTRPSNVRFTPESGHRIINAAGGLALDGA